MGARDSLSFLMLIALAGCSSRVMPSPGKSPPVNNGGGGSGGGSAALSCAGQRGQTVACCGDGMMTCSSDEFPTWGPCLSASGAVLTCCTSGEFSGCDGGAPPVLSNGCQAGEFGSCDGGVPPGCVPGAPAPGCTPLPPMPMLCQEGGANDEPEILVGFSPASGQSVGAGGQIKVWVNDEGAPIIAPGEVVDPTTGQITNAGDRTAKAPDGFLWEPALYIAPQSAENGGTPHFPTAIRGDYNNTTKKGPGLHVAGMDPVPAGAMLQEKYTAEFIWDVSSLHLSPGAYIGEFVIHDGDEDRGVGCVTIVIQ